ncbi:MAG: low temperature requirement protein A, partial [Chloroflexota bacterium]
IQIGNYLSDNLTLLGFAQFIIFMTVVWWAWSGETFYQNRFVVDDLTHRLLVFVQMTAVAALGISVSSAFGDLYVQFTIAYVITRLMLVIMYVRTYLKVPESRQLSARFIIGFSIGILIWLSSLLLPAELHWVGWIAGIAFELCVPLLPLVQIDPGQWKVDMHHLTERFGIFTIIVLGESFVKVLDDAQGTKFGGPQMAFTLGGMLVLFSLWWLYFSDTADKLVDFGTRSRGVSWTYGHLPLASGLVAFAVGAKKLYSSTLDYPADPLNPSYRLIYATALVLFLVALAFIDYGVDDEETHQSQTTEAIIHLVSAVIIGAIGLTATNANAIRFVSMIAIVMLIQVGFSIYFTAQESDHAADGHEHEEEEMHEIESASQ